MKTNTIFSFFIALFIISCNSAQEQSMVKIEPLTITDAPGVHSYSLGKTSDGKWLILGGRIEGLHKMRPFEAFRQNENNKNVFLIDPENNKTWSTDLSVLSPSIFE
ncbi:hypothetical protein [Lacinutrix jangbogonensis]|uniref:hypothetical protein n=1 Tax=Lacinutrix jangbogonensis TaxID=1469557 RepID=UPI00068FE13F|nr:hypothetical protein [Lacinutrix jangbogonensis]